MDPSVPAALVGALVAGAGGAFVPGLIARIPEPEPEPAPEPVPKPAAESDAGTDSAAAPVPHREPGAEPEPEPEPEETFADIAALPGLAWRSVVVAASAGAVLGAALGWHWALAMWVPLVPAYVALGLVDWRRQLLPTFVIAPLYVVVVGLAVVGWAVTRDTGALVHAGLGWLVYGGLFVVLWFVHPRGLGYGDVRLSGVLGLALGWLGWGPLLVGLYAGLVLGGVLGVVLTVLKVVDRRNNPFGPYMLLGALAGVVWGGQVWSGLAGG